MIIFLLSTLGLLAFSQADLNDWGECKSTYIPKLKDNRTVCTYHMEVKDDHCMTFNGKEIASDCEDQHNNTVECVACYSDDSNCAGTDRSIPFQNVTLSCGGVKRYVISVNGAEPGPPIRVKYGTIVNLTFHNNMMKTNTTMLGMVCIRKEPLVRMAYHTLPSIPLHRAATMSTRFTQFRLVHFGTILMGPAKYQTV
ncbi:uncharacterized protein [Ptychodera flava]|uniref:uncharacterized protein isoform X2 n=1 Tax=Ptychodera flava TaxID=63121 RepID=UPI003969F414